MGQTDSEHDANSYYYGLNAPTAEDLEVDPNTLQKYGVVGTLTPQQSQVATTGPSAFTNIQTDPRLQQAQMSALSSLEGTANNGGLNASDVANLNTIQQSQNSNNAANQKAILDQAKQRGQGGSGASMAAQLEAEQGGANSAAASGNQVAANAQARALDAMSNAGTLAGGIQAQQFGQQAQAAGAEDALSKFNAANTQQNNEYNTTANNNAQAVNLGNAQNASNANVGNYNNGLYYNSGAKQTAYGDAASLANAKAGTDIQQGNLDMNNNNSDWTHAGQVVGIGENVLGTLGGLFSQGGMVPGRPHVPGNSTVNDTVPAMLSPGELVVPRTIASSPEKVARFARHVQKPKYNAKSIYDELTRGRGKV